MDRIDNSDFGFQETGYIGDDVKKQSYYIQELHKRFSEARKSSQASNQDIREIDKVVSCQYCLGNNFLQIKIEHFLTREIPSDYEISHIDTFPNAECVAVPCDCHSGYVNYGVNNGDNQPTKPVDTFSVLFSQNIAYHPYGRRLKRYRQRLSGHNSGYTHENNTRAV